MENKKVVCEICNSEFYPIDIGKNHYIARDNVVIGLAAITKTTEHKLYDAFDCPVCKCQNIIGERKRGFISAVSENVIPDEVVFVEKEENEDESEDDKPECFGSYNDEDIKCIMCDVVSSCKNKMKNKPECYGTGKITPECWECFYKWACAKKLESTIPEIPICYGEHKNNDFCACCEYAKKCKDYYLESKTEVDKNECEKPECFGNFDGDCVNDWHDCEYLEECEEHSKCKKEINNEVAKNE